MGQVHLKVKDVDEFFNELHCECRQKKSYSLLEIIQKKGATFEEVSKWAISNENWAYILELCIELCCLHLQDAELYGDLSEEKIFYYFQQNRALIHFR